MIRLSPLDLSFLLLERPTRPFHMAAMTIFQKPKGQQSSFGPRLFEAYRHSQAVKPFNYKLKWLGKDVAAWETVEPDMRNHIRRIDLPAPGSMQQFYETVSFLNAGLLDRGHPLWECHIIDGIENGRLAVMIKVHHALIDGEGGLRAMRNFLSDSPRNKRLAGPWMALESGEKPRRSRPSVSQIQRLQSMLKGLTKLPAEVIGVGTDVLDLGAQSLNLKPRMASLPFTARHTLFNNTAKSAARAYANLELPLADVKAVAKATDTSVNDVVMTIIDDALHHYLREHGAPTDRPLVAFMPMSLRDESGGGEGNQVSVELIAMGAPEASLSERLRQINRATTNAKHKGRRMQTTLRQAYTLMLAGSMTMSDTLPWFGKVPSANLVISNMKGPTEQLYLAGAPMVAFLGLPILPPGAGLNVTFASVNKDIGIAIGAAPEAVDEPFRLAELIEQAFHQLETKRAQRCPRPHVARSPCDRRVNQVTPNTENAMKNIGAMLKQRAVVSPQLEAYVEPSANVRMDYTQMNALANRCASVLTSLGVGKGDRVALLMPNCVEFCCLFYGAAKIGAVAVPLNTRLAAPELEFILSDSGSKVLVYGEAFAAVAEAIKADTNYHCTVIDWVLVAGGSVSLAKRLEAADANEPAFECGGSDNLFIMYTSGTTGHPKGVVHTHDSVHTAATSNSLTADSRYQDRILLPLPMFHVAALTTVIFCAVRGITLISMPQLDPAKMWSLIVDERVSIAGAVPAILNFMRQVPEFAELDAPDFRFFMTGGAPMPEALIEMYAAKNMQVMQGYALTESCGSGTVLLGEDALRKIGSAGRACMFADVRVRSDDGVISESGEGEVVIKSDFLLKEYWNRPDATRDAFDNGWFRTGDIGEIDDDGYLYIKDRIKDMIISGGENIYPAEIESVVIGIPGVSEVAVIGLSDEKWGEIACAIVVGDQSKVSEQQIVEFCGTRLARYKVPKKVIFAEAIPRNPSGKILKRVLREKYR